MLDNFSKDLDIRQKIRKLFVNSTTYIRANEASTILFNSPPFWYWHWFRLLLLTHQLDKNLCQTLTKQSKNHKDYIRVVNAYKEAWIILLSFVEPASGSSNDHPTPFVKANKKYDILNKEVITKSKLQVLFNSLKKAKYAKNCFILSCVLLRIYFEHPKLAISIKKKLSQALKQGGSLEKLTSWMVLYCINQPSNSGISREFYTKYRWHELLLYEHFLSELYGVHRNKHAFLYDK